MGHPSARKGKGYEREVVEKLGTASIDAERTWGSDGRSRGLDEEVDLVVHDVLHFQLKRPADVPSYLYPKGPSAASIITDEKEETDYAVLWLKPHVMRLFQLETISPSVETSSRHTVGNQWVPDDVVDGQIVREDYKPDSDLVIFRARTLRRLLSSVREHNESDQK